LKENLGQLDPIPFGPAAQHDPTLLGPTTQQDPIPKLLGLILLSNPMLLSNYLQPNSRLFGVWIRRQTQGS